jgi:pyridoxine kinase
MARVLAISSQVVYGPVGLSCIVPALQSGGHEVLAIPTILLSNHPGHGKTEGRATAAAEMSAMIAALEKLDAFENLDAIITGYFASAEQIEIVAALIARLRCKIILIDPVLGDHGKLYVAHAVAESIRDGLVPLATIVTPNAFELSWLTGLPTDNAEQAVQAARSLGIIEVIATSVVSSAHELSTLRIAADRIETISSPIEAKVPNGTGDLLSGLYLSRILGPSPQSAFADAMAKLQQVIKQSKGTMVLDVGSLIEAIKI